MNIRRLDHLAVEIESEKTLLVMEARRPYENAILTSSEENEDLHDAKPFTWPGEYETQGWLIKGVETDDQHVIFSAVIEGMRIVHLGEAKAISEQNMTEIGDIDVLILPVDTELRTAEEAKNFSSKLEARIIVPVGNLAENFIEMTSKDITAQSKVRITKADLPVDTTQVLSLLGSE